MPRRRNSATVCETSSERSVSGLKIIRPAGRRVKSASIANQCVTCHLHNGLAERSPSLHRSWNAKRRRISGQLRFRCRIEFAPTEVPERCKSRLRRAPKGRPDRLLRQAKNEQIDSGSLRNLAMADRITGGRERQPALQPSQRPCRKGELRPFEIAT